MSLKKELVNEYGNKLRVRVCGILLEKDAVLMVKHNTIGDEGYMWIPPGGGGEYEMSTKDTLRREFKEEVGLDIEVGELLFVSEFKNSKFHAIEMFFSVERVGGKLICGEDPEKGNESQIIMEVKYMNFIEINKIDKKKKHFLFKHCSSVQELLNMSGFYYNN